MLKKKLQQKAQRQLESISKSLGLIKKSGKYSKPEVQAKLREMRQNLQVLMLDGDTYAAFLARHISFLVWTWSWQVIVQRDLDAFMRGDFDRYAVAAPPRHGKSKLITEHFPARFLKAFPFLNVHCSSHTQELVNTFSYNTRSICQELGILSHDSTNIKQWRTKYGGAYRAFGVGGSPHGRGGNLQNIDDPIGSREDAESPKMRQKLKDWYENDVLTRLDPGKNGVILIQTRFHEDDLWAFALSKNPERWRVRVFPAICDDEKNDPLGRREGEALCPDLYTADELHRIKSEVSEYTWLSIYQQRPTAREGLFFKISKVRIVDGINRAEVVALVRYWDLAATENPANCETAGVRGGILKDGTIFIDHAAWCHYNPSDRDSFMREIAERDQAYHPAGVRQVEEKQPAGAGVERAINFAKLMHGLPFGHGDIKGDKIVRADPLAGQVGAGNVVLVKGVDMPTGPRGAQPWIPKLIEAWRVFPMGETMDTVDASSGMYFELTTRRRGEITSSKLPERSGRKLFG